MKKQAQEGTDAMGHNSNLVLHVSLYSNKMIAEREEKRCEPDGPPAGVGSCAKHATGWVGAKTVTFSLFGRKKRLVRMPERDQSHQISRKICTFRQQFTVG